jgi:hypothetical protein
MADDIHAEQEFVTAFATRLETQAEAGGDAPAVAPKDAGKDAGKDSTAATPAAPTPTPKKTDTATTDTPDEEIASPDGSDDDSDDDGDETATTDTGEGEPADAAEETDEPEPVEDDADDDDDSATVDEAKQTADFQALLKKNGLKATIDDLPADAQPIVRATLANMQSAFTRTQMEAAEFRKERTAFESERRFNAENPHLMIAELLSKKPELLELVNAEIDKLDDPDKAKLFEITLRDTRKATADKVTAEDTATERALQRADAVETYTRRACTKLGLPFDSVVNAVALALMEKPESARDLTEQELDAVIGQQQRVLKRHTVAVVRENAKKKIQDRARDRRTTTPAVRSGAGSATPTPTSRPAPKSDADFIAHMAAKHGR